MIGLLTALTIAYALILVLVLAVTLIAILYYLTKISYKLGRSLEWDGAKERIVGDEAANKLLRRAYRKGWEYPV